MKKLIFILLLFISGCGKNLNDAKYNNNSILKLNMTFDEFKLKLKDYAENNPYPKTSD